MASLGGQARAKKLSAKRRREIASLGGVAAKRTYQKKMRNKKKSKGEKK